MKKILQITGLCALIFGLAVSCNPDDVNPEQLAAPAGLSVGTLTTTTAALSWNAVEGADKYFVAVGEGTPAEVTAAAYEATGLTAATDYIWKVQAVKGNTSSDWAEGPGFTTSEDESGIPAPTDLAVTKLIHNRATLSWRYSGTADYYALVINDGDEFLVSDLTYEAVGLTPATGYTWKVRVREDGEWSGWAQGEAFTTGADGVEFVYSNQPLFWDSRAGAGTSWFWLNLFTFDIDEPEEHGWQIGLDVISPLTDRNPTTEYLNIPEGTYTFSNTLDRNVVLLSENTALVEMVNYGQAGTFHTITGGTMTVAGNHADGYIVTINATLRNGTVFTAYYTGAITIKNPYYIKPSGKTVELEAFNGIAQLDYIPDAYGNGAIDGWLVRAYQSPDVYIEDGRFRGHGWTCDLQFHAPINSGEILPDHEYTVDRSGLAWTSLGGNGSNGLNVKRVEVGITVDTRWLAIGKVTTSYAAGVYTFNIEAIDYGMGDLYKFTIQGTPPAAAPSGAGRYLWRP